jgi:hypothetical protein
MQATTTKPDPKVEDPESDAGKRIQNTLICSYFALKTALEWPYFALFVLLLPVAKCVYCAGLFNIAACTLNHTRGQAPGASSSTAG